MASIGGVADRFRWAVRLGSSARADTKAATAADGSLENDADLRLR
jgi:hypothetical protein